MPTRPSKEHWILRITPQCYRERVTRIGLYFGIVCSFIWMMGAFFGLFFGPALFAIWRPEAPISQPILWLRRISGSEAFVLTYTLSMMAFIGIIHTGHTLLNYLRNNRKS
jgi:vacuolar-type H+-ATPase subunit I/STV1